MVNGYSVRILNEAGDPVGPGMAALEVRSFSWAAEGGPEAAELWLRDPAPQACAAGWLGSAVEIHDADGDPVWWGFLAAVDVAQPGAYPTAGGAGPGTAPAYRLEIDLTSVRNRVAAVYRSRSGERGETAWAEDPASRAAYGVHEERLSLAGSNDPQAALQARDGYLALAARPRLRLGTPQAVGAGSDGAAATARLRCLGWWATLGWQYYAQPKGRLATGAAAGGSLKLGLGFDRSSIYFGNAEGCLQDIEGGFAAVGAGDTLVVAGSAANDGIYTVVSTGGSVRAYTAASVGCQAGGARITDAANGLGWINARDCIRIRGSVRNDGYVTVKKAAEDGSWVEVWNPLADEAAGATITLQRGNWVRVAEPVTEEMPGRVVGVRAGAAALAQGILLPANVGSWQAAQVALRVRRVGPLRAGDGLRVALAADAAGAPGAELGSVILPAGEIVGGTGWQEVALPASVPLSMVATTWLVISREGAPDANAYFEIDLAGAAPAGCTAVLLHRGLPGAGWSAVPGQSGPALRITGAAETSEQIADMLRAGQFVSGAQIEASTGIATCPYRQGDRRLSEEVVELLRTGAAAGGTSGATRLLACVERDRRVRVYTAPAPDDACCRLAGPETLGPHGERLPRLAVLCGVWLAAPEIAPGEIGASPAFVERCVIDVAHGRRTLVERDAAGPAEDLLARLQPYVASWTADR